MIKIIVESEEVKQKIINESKKLHYDPDVANPEKYNTLMHLYMLPDEAWIIQEPIPKYYCQVCARPPHNCLCSHPD